uniref:Protein shisa-7 n=1 Tax=Macrostomum lignano TaxID=282301 RepID=A0A1I8FRX4_9PLAT
MRTRCRRSISSKLPQYTAGSQYTRYRSPTVFGTVAAVGFFGMSVGFTLIICSFIVYSSSRVWGQHPGPRRSAAADCRERTAHSCRSASLLQGTGLEGSSLTVLYASAPPSSCAAGAQGQLLPCRHRSSRRLEWQRQQRRRKKSAGRGSCSPPSPAPRARAYGAGRPTPSTELLMECTAHACLTPTDLTREHRAAHGVPEPAHACLTPTDLTREHRAAHGVPEPAHACLTPTDLTREHRAAHGVPEPPTPLQFEASPLPPGASRRGGIRSLTLSMALASSKPLILWCGLKPPTAAGEGHGMDSRPPLSTPVGSMPLGVSPLSSSTDSDSSRSTVKTAGHFANGANLVTNHLLAGRHGVRWG